MRACCLLMMSFAKNNSDLARTWTLTYPVARLKIFHCGVSGMTVCVAALCDDRKGIVIAADKMIGLGTIESEADIHKIFKIHENWWVMLAGDDISSAFDIIDHAKQKLAQVQSIDIDAAVRAVVQSYGEKRSSEAEAIHLIPRGLTLEQLNSPASANAIPDTLRVELREKISSHYLGVCLLVVGFDVKKKGHIFSVWDAVERGRPCRHDIPGYHAIGSGAHGAIYMMAYRNVSPAMQIREALYYVAEGKYFGEFASGVGLRTDLYILRAGKPRIRIAESTVDRKLMKLCQQLGPRELTRLKAIDILNELHGRLMNTVPKLKLRKEGKETRITI
jgi:20S proteasome alpha/beta subunit